MEEISSEDQKISRMNSGGLINITTENLWRDVYSAMAKIDYVLWNIKLDAIWLILGGDLQEDNDEHVKIINEFNEIDKKIYELGSLKPKKVGFKLDGTYNPENSAKQYLYLRKKSLFLRRLQNAQGKGTAYSEGSSDDWD